VTVPAGTYARNFYAPKASIDTIQIKDAAIENAQIALLAVERGNIKDLAVDTLQIAEEAVTIPRLVYRPTTEIIFHQPDYVNESGGSLVSPFSSIRLGKNSLEGSRDGKYVLCNLGEATFNAMGGSVAVECVAENLYMGGMQAFDNKRPYEIWAGLTLTRTGGGGAPKILRNYGERIDQHFGTGSPGSWSPIPFGHNIPLTVLPTIQDIPPPGEVTYKAECWMWEPMANYQGTPQYPQYQNRGITNFRKELIIRVGTTSFQLMGTKR